jgi:hypothetical protein
MECVAKVKRKGSSSLLRWREIFCHPKMVICLRNPISLWSRRVLRVLLNFNVGSIISLHIVFHRLIVTTYIIRSNSYRLFIEQKSSIKAY